MAADRVLAVVGRLPVMSYRQGAAQRATRKRTARLRRTSGLLALPGFEEEWTADDWATPWPLFRELEAEFGPFDRDVCATERSAKVAAYWTKADDALLQEWRGRLWCNPPYSRCIDWLRKAYEASQAGAVVVCLIPAHTDAAYWHDWVVDKAFVRFLRGRIRFTDGNGRAGPSPFASAVVVYDGRNSTVPTRPRGRTR